MTIRWPSQIYVPNWLTISSAVFTQVAVVHKRQARRPSYVRNQCLYGASENAGLENAGLEFCGQIAGLENTGLFKPCYLVRQIPVLHFPVLHFQRPRIYALCAGGAD